MQEKVDGRVSRSQRTVRQHRHIKVAYLARGEPVLSIDTKKKELIGNFAREGPTHMQAQLQTLDHDFPSAGQGKLIPHGLYDLARNDGYLHLSTETNELCCDSIAHWWKQHGVKNYSDAKRLLVLCNGGGSNASTQPDRAPIVCPCHARLSGVTFHTVDIARKFMEKAKTAAGLKVTTEVLGGVYAKGKKVAADFLVNMRIVFDEHLPRWNYRAIPANG